MGALAATCFGNKVCKPVTVYLACIYRKSYLDSSLLYIGRLIQKRSISTIKILL